VFLIGIVAAGVFIQLPYYALEPGSVRPTAEAVTVTGAESFESEGMVEFTTVAIRQITPFDAVAAWLDDDVDVLSEEDLFGPRTAEENRQFNIQLMDTSKLDAVRVALVELGYEVPITVTGQLVVEIGEETPADGVLSLGDVIVSVDDTEIREVADLNETLRPTRPGDEIVLGVEREGEAEVVDVPLVLGERSDDGENGFIGVSLSPRDLVYDFPFEVEIDSGNVGGPSAGLAFTLSVLDVLTPGELTGGSRVAVTGTILGDGSVGPVGGVEQKAAAVRNAGIELFLVPVGEGELARKHAGDGVTVVEVADLDEALAALDQLGGNALALGSPGRSEEALAGD
jgi:PDZ domain-containing protein